MGEHAAWSWLVPAGVIAVGGAVAGAAGPLWGIATAVALLLTLWQLLLPVYYEISPAGCSRQVLGRERLVPWGAVRSYQARATGMMLFRRVDPAPIDALGCWFVPYPPDHGEMLALVRQYLQHAVELPT
jgi:hypothetical protein